MVQVNVRLADWHSESQGSAPGPIQNLVNHQQSLVGNRITQLTPVPCFLVVSSICRHSTMLCKPYSQTQRFQDLVGCIVEVGFP